MQYFFDGIIITLLVIIIVMIYKLPKSVDNRVVKNLAKKLGDSTDRLKEAVEKNKG